MGLVRWVSVGRENSCQADGLGWMPGAHVVEGEKQHLQVVLWIQHTYLLKKKLWTDEMAEWEKLLPSNLIT